MTVTVYPGPGVDSWTTPGFSLTGRSTRFAATVNGTSAYVYGYARTSPFTSTAWSGGATVQQSFVKFAADEDAVLVISRLPGGTAITSCTVYPSLATPVVAGGVVTLRVPPGVNLWVECNGDRANVLHVFSCPIIDDPVSAGDPNVVTWASTGRAVQSVNTGADTITFASPHGFVTGDPINPVSTGTLPTDTVGTWTVHDVLFAIRVSDTVIQVARTWDGAAVDLTNAGTGTLTIYPRFFRTAGATLLIEEGVHKFGRLFSMATDTTLYLAPGAVATGHFDTRGQTRITIRGPGVLDGTWGLSENVPADANVDAAQWWVFFAARDGTNWISELVLREFTLVAHPYHLTSAVGPSDATDVQVISPWYWRTDGIQLYASTDYLTCRMARVYSYVGDDNLALWNRWRDFEADGCYFFNSNNGCILGGYRPFVGRLGYTCVIRDSYAMNLARASAGRPGDNTSPAPGGTAIFHSWSSGKARQQGFGQFDITIERLTVCGPLAGMLWSIGNTEHPPHWGQGHLVGPGDDYGLQGHFTFRDWVVEQEPAQRSLLMARDKSNTCFDFEFDGITIAGVELTARNLHRFVDMDPGCFDIRVGKRTVKGY